MVNGYQTLLTTSMRGFVYYKTIPLTNKRIEALSNECYGVTPTEQQLQGISNNIDRFINNYGNDEISVSEVCDIIGEVVLDF